MKITHISLIGVEDFDEENIYVSIIDMKQAEYADSLPQSYQSCLSYDDGRKTIDISWEDFEKLTKCLELK